MSLSQKISKLGIVFNGRLEPEILKDAIGYSNFNECRLAVESLCDALFEYSVSITMIEFQQIQEIAEETGASVTRVEPLKSLVPKPNGQISED